MITPVFPLPNVVFFPKTRLPLHVFEDRYRLMTREALSGDRSIVMVLLRDGWEQDYYGRPAIHEVACLGRIESYEVLDGGKYNIILSGKHRVRLLRELHHKPYRMAEVELFTEAGYDDASEDIIQRRNRLGGLFMRYVELASRRKAGAYRAVSRRSFEALVNRVAMTLNMPPEDKQMLLEIDDLAERCDCLLPALQEQLEALVLVRSFEHIKPRDPGRN